MFFNVKKKEKPKHNDLQRETDTKPDLACKK